jgi:hypothetical protein
VKYLEPPVFDAIAKNHRFCANSFQCALILVFSRVTDISDEQGPLSGLTWQGGDSRKGQYNFGFFCKFSQDPHVSFSHLYLFFPFSFQSCNLPPLHARRRQALLLCSPPRPCAPALRAAASSHPFSVRRCSCSSRRRLRVPPAPGAAASECPCSARAAASECPCSARAPAKRARRPSLYRSPSHAPTSSDQAGGQAVRGRGVLLCAGRHPRRAPAKRARRPPLRGGRR